MAKNNIGKFHGYYFIIKIYPLHGQGNLQMFVTPVNPSNSLKNRWACSTKMLKCYKFHVNIGQFHKNPNIFTYVT